MLRLIFSVAISAAFLATASTTAMGAVIPSSILSEADASNAVRQLLSRAHVAQADINIAEKAVAKAYVARRRLIQHAALPQPSSLKPLPAHGVAGGESSLLAASAATPPPAASQRSPQQSVVSVWTTLAETCIGIWWKNPKAPCVINAVDPNNPTLVPSAPVPPSFALAIPSAMPSDTVGSVETAGATNPGQASYTADKTELQRIALGASAATPAPQFSAALSQALAATPPVVGTVPSPIMTSVAHQFKSGDSSATITLRTSVNLPAYQAPQNGTVYFGASAEADAYLDFSIDMSLYRFPGHLHSAGEVVGHEVPWGNNIGPIVRNSSATP